MVPLFGDINTSKSFWNSTTCFYETNKKTGHFTCGLLTTATTMTFKLFYNNKLGHYFRARWSILNHFFVVQGRFVFVVVKLSRFVFIFSEQPLTLKTHSNYFLLSLRKVQYTKSLNTLQIFNSLPTEIIHM